jgi:hypothetical protein
MLPLIKHKIKYRSRQRRSRNRVGATVILGLILMVCMLAMIAFALDIGYLCLTRTQLQRTADAAAMAACWDLVDEDALRGDTSRAGAITRARRTARDYVARNPVCNRAPSVELNGSNRPAGDVVLGFMPNLHDLHGGMQYDQPARFNAVTVRVQRTAQKNGMVPLFFARIFGISQASLQAEATAAMLWDIGGLETPPTGDNIPLLPFALDLETWLAWEDGQAADNWRWDVTTRKVTAEADAIGEFNLYPQDTGSAANRGTVNIGIDANSTSHVSRQILEGVSQADFDYHGGKLEFDANGELLLSGDPGISAGFKDELAQITGQRRIIPVFREVHGPGNNALYTIVKFIGVRIMDVDLTSGSKHLIVQPVHVEVDGALPGNNPSTSRFLFAPVRLVR